MAEVFAKQGWLVRVRTAGAVPPIVSDLAVGRSAAQDAVAAVLSHPEVGYEDQVTLSPDPVRESKPTCTNELSKS